MKSVQYQYKSNKNILIIYYFKEFMSQPEHQTVRIPKVLKNSEQGEQSERLLFDGLWL